MALIGDSLGIIHYNVSNSNVLGWQPFVTAQLIDKIRGTTPNVLHMNSLDTGKTLLISRNQLPPLIENIHVQPNQIFSILARNIFQVDVFHNSTPPSVGFDKE